MTSNRKVFILLFSFSVMNETNLLVVLFLFSVLVLSSCNNDGLDKTDTSSEKIKNSGGEELLDVRAEYSFCYDTGAYDPTQRSQCELSLTYKECKEWMTNKEGMGSTTFYANFTGGEPTISGRTANEYYMVVHYDADKAEKTDRRAVFKDIPSEFMHFVRGGCYPNATIEIYNMDDELMGSMSFDYSSE
jgi:hypothetical protein